MKEQEIFESYVDNDVLESQRINKKFAIASISVFLCLIILPSLLWYAIAIFAPSIADTLDFDTGENRAKAAMPEEVNLATLTADAEAYYNDRVPFRSILYTVQNNFFHALEKPYTNHILPFLTDLFYSDYQGDHSHLEDGTQLDIQDLFGQASEKETLPDVEIGNQGDVNCEHSLVTVFIKAASCTTYGQEEKECSKCGYTEIHYREKTAHSELLLSSVPATCLKAGQNVYQCAVCHEQIIKSTEKPPHTPMKIRTQAASYEDYGYTLNLCITCGTHYRTDITPKKIDTSYFASQITGPKERGTILGRHNWLFFTGDSSLAYYQGTNVLSTAQMDDYVKTMKELKAVCDKKGIQLAFMSMPNREIVYAEHMPTYTVNTPRRSEVFKDYIDKNTDLTYVYPLEELKAFKPYFQVCFKYDTHWNPAGAFIGTQTLYRDLGLPNVSIMDVQVISATRNGGDLINIGGLNQSQYTGDTTYNIEYRPENTQRTVYQTSDGNLVISECSNATNQKKLMFFGDSFRTAMTPFLQKDFTRCTIAHRNLLIQNAGGSLSSYDANLIHDVKNADVLVVSTVERHDYSLVIQAKELIRILNSN